MSTMQQPDVAVTVTDVAATEVKKFMDQEGVAYDQGGLRVQLRPERVEGALQRSRSAWCRGDHLGLSCMPEV